MPKRQFRFSSLSPLILLAVIAANRLVGLIRSVMLARLWGAGVTAASFELASTVTSSLYEATVGAVIAAMFVPAYAARRKLSLQNADSFARSFFPLVAFFTLLLYSPLLVFPKASLSLLAKEATETLVSEAVTPTRLLAASRLLLSLASLFVGILQTDKRPFYPAAVYLLASLFSLLPLFFFKRAPTATALSLVTLLADLFVFFALALAAARTHRFTPTETRLFPKPYLLLGRTAGVILFSAFLPTASLFASLFSARLGEEAITANGYALKWVLLSASLLASSFHAVYYPRFSVAERRSLAQKLKKPLTLILLLASSLSGFLILISGPLFMRLYQSETFGEEAITLTVSLLRRYALSLPLLAASALLNDVAYLRGKTKELALISIASLAFDALLLSQALVRQGVKAIPTAFFLAVLARTLGGVLLTFSPRRTATKGDKLRLLLVLSDKNIGGAGRQLLSYLSCFDRQSFDVTVALPEGAALADEVTRFGVRLLFCGKETSFSLAATKAYYRLIRAEKPHIVHTNAALSARIAALFAAVPIRIYTRHCVYPLPTFFKYRPVRLAMRLATGLLSTSVIAVAKEAADNLYGMGVSQRQVCVIENGVQPILPSQEDRQAIRRRYSIAPNDTVAVICARLEADKDIATLVKAVALNKKRKQPITALIVGTGSEEASLKSLAEALSVEDRTVFVGFVKDVSPFLNAADLYVNCSVGTEATSLGILEAMSLSLPVIATNYGGNPQVVKEGKNGILIAQRDPKALAEALSRMTECDLRERLGKASYALYASHYSAETMARRNEALYKNLFFQKGYYLS